MTSTKKRYAVVIGRRVQLFFRPAQTSIKKYREPKSWLVKTCKNKAEALRIAEKWEMLGQF